MTTEQDTRVKLSADEIRIGSLARNPNPSQEELEATDHVINIFIKPSAGEGRLGLITELAAELKEKGANVHSKSHEEIIVRGRKNDLNLAVVALFTGGRIDQTLCDSLNTEIDEWKPAAVSNSRTSARERHDWGRGGVPSSREH